MRKRILPLFLAFVMASTPVYASLPTQSTTVATTQTVQSTTQSEVTTQKKDAEMISGSDAKQTTENTETAIKESTTTVKDLTTEEASKEDSLKATTQETKTTSTEEKDTEATTEASSTESEIIIEKNEAPTDSMTSDYLVESFSEKKSDKADAISEKEETKDLSKKEVTELTKQDHNGLTETVHQIRVNTTLVSPEAADCSSIEEVFDRSWELLYANFITYATVYEMEGVTDSYVAFLDNGRMNESTGTLIGAEFIIGEEDDPQVQTDITFDKKTGIVYIPKYHYFTEDGKETAYALQCQVMSTVDLENTKSTICVDIKNELDVKTAYENANITTDSINNEITIPVVATEDAGKISMDNIEVYLNDRSVPLELTDETNASYNKETGEFTLAGSPINMYHLTIVLKDKTLVEKVTSFFSVNAFASQSASISGAGDMNTYPRSKTFDQAQLKSLETGLQFNYTGKLYKGIVKGVRNERNQVVERETRDYVYVPYVPRGDGKVFYNELRAPFYNMIAEGSTLSKIIASYKTINGGKNVIRNFYYNNQESRWSAFSMSPPTGKLTSINTNKAGDTVTFNWGTYTDWKRSNSAYKNRTDDKKNYAYLIIGMCSHPSSRLKDGNDLAQDMAHYRVTVLAKQDVNNEKQTAGYLVLGIISGPKKGQKDSQSSATMIKLVVPPSKPKDPEFDKITDQADVSQKVSIQKTDKAGAALSGAEFKITDTVNTKNVYTITTGSGGTASKTITLKNAVKGDTFTYVTKYNGWTLAEIQKEYKDEYGKIYASKAEATTALNNNLATKKATFTRTYRVQETVAPDGYELSDEVKEIKITGDNKSVTIIGKYKTSTKKNTTAPYQEKLNTEIFIDDQEETSYKTESVTGSAYFYHRIELKKIDADTKALLPGAKFQVFAPTIEKEGMVLVGIDYSSYTKTTSKTNATLAYTRRNIDDSGSVKALDAADKTFTAYTNGDGIILAQYLYRCAPATKYYYWDEANSTKSYAESKADFEEKYPDRTLYQTQADAKAAADQGAVDTASEGLVRYSAKEIEGPPKASGGTYAISYTGIFGNYLEFDPSIKIAYASVKGTSNPMTKIFEDDLLKGANTTTVTWE